MTNLRRVTRSRETENEEPRRVRFELGEFGERGGGGRGVEGDDISESEGAGGGGETEQRQQSRRVRCEFGEESRRCVGCGCD